MDWIKLIPDIIKLILELLSFIKTFGKDDPGKAIVEISAAFARARAALDTPGNEDDKAALKAINDLIRRGRP